MNIRKTSVRAAAVVFGGAAVAGAAWIAIPADAATTGVVSVSGTNVIVYTAATGMQASAVSTSWPPLPPRCGHVVPEGSVFVERVQPPYGLAYEIWRLPSGGLITVYC